MGILPIPRSHKTFESKREKRAFMNYGYITVASAIPQVRVADVDYNVEQIPHACLHFHLKHPLLSIFAVWL